MYNWNFNVLYKKYLDLLKGLGTGLWLAVISLFFAILIGLVFAKGATSGVKALKQIAKAYVTVFRNTPLLILIYIVYFGLPETGISFNKEQAFIIALSFYGGAYMTEVFRAGLEAIPKGIIEAGKAIGLKTNQITIKIQLPIMFKSVLPSMGNYLISLFKDTSLAASIGLTELTFVTRQLNADTFRIFEVWTAAAVLYVATCYLMLIVLRAIERKLYQKG